MGKFPDAQFYGEVHLVGAQNETLISNTIYNVLSTIQVTWH